MKSMSALQNQMFGDDYTYESSKRHCTSYMFARGFRLDSNQYEVHSRPGWAFGDTLMNTFKPSGEVWMDQNRLGTTMLICKETEDW